jgi:hypothetical protein
VLESKSVAELPKQLAALRRKLEASTREIIQWQKIAKKHRFTDDLQHQIALFLACHRAADDCAQGNAVRAFQTTEQAYQIADQWRKSPSGREDQRNMVHDHYGGIHDDTMNAFYATATEVVENILDWEFGVVSARTIQFSGNDAVDEPAEFHDEDAILLCQMQAFRTCCESILPVYMEQKDVAYCKILVAHYEIAAWKGLIVEGTQRY